MRTLVIEGERNENEMGRTVDLGRSMRGKQQRWDELLERIELARRNMVGNMAK